MAREFIDGFETGSLQLWDTINGNMSAQNSALTDAGGSWKCRCGDDSAFIEKTLTARDSYYVALRFYRQYNDGGSAKVIKFLNGSTVLAVVDVSTGAPAYVRAYRGDSGTLLGTGSIALATNTTYLIEIYYLPKTDATGSFIVKVNGVVDINITSTITADSALQINRIRFGYRLESYYDSIVVESASWIGRTYITGLSPNGAGVTTAWTPTTGSNYNCVDEVGPSDTDYVYTNTADNIDTYALPSLGLSDINIKCVSVAFRADYVGSPTPTKIAPVVRIASTDYAGTDKTVSESFVCYGQIWEQNPNTSAAWTSANIDDLEIGIKARS